MPATRIILANSSRLLREMLNRILLKTENLQVVREITDPQNLPAALDGEDVSWVIISLPSDSRMPRWIDAYIVKHPRVRVMAVANDGSWVKTKWLETREEDLEDLSLHQFIDILGGVTESA